MTDDNEHTPARTGPLSSLPYRTLIQGLGTDLAFALALLLYDSLQATSVDWRLLLVTAGKTALMTVASYVMKRVRPPVSP